MAYSTDGPGFLRSLEDAGQADSGAAGFAAGRGRLGAGGRVCSGWAGKPLPDCQSDTGTGRGRWPTEVNLWRPGMASVAGWGLDAGEYDMIVNTTSLGMHPNEDVASCPAAGAVCPPPVCV